MQIIQNTSVTLITGFLGSGKTTLINQLIQHKSADERWGLLINEFGNIGIDSHLIEQNSEQSDKQNQSTDTATIAIREVNGGCICCTSQLPLQIGLSRLLSETKPQRILIEPTGLAHPNVLIEQLSEPHWQSTLSMQSVIGVLSAKQWLDPRYRGHEGYQSHVQYADILLINRAEKLSELQRAELVEWVVDINPHVNPDTDINWAHESVSDGFFDNLLQSVAQPSQIIKHQKQQQGKQTRVSLLPLQKTSLAGSTGNDTSNNQSHQTSEVEVVELSYRYHQQQTLNQDTANSLPINIGGWRLPADWIFDAHALQNWLLSLVGWERIKGVIHTNEGWVKVNFTPDSLNTRSCPDQTDSRIEFILIEGSRVDEELSVALWEQWDTELLSYKVYG